LTLGCFNVILEALQELQGLFSTRIGQPEASKSPEVRMAWIWMRKWFFMFWVSVYFVHRNTKLTSFLFQHSLHASLEPWIQRLRRASGHSCTGNSRVVERQGAGAVPHTATTRTMMTLTTALPARRILCFNVLSCLCVCATL
jgi:hypothetical protein